MDFQTPEPRAFSDHTVRPPSLEGTLSRLPPTGAPEHQKDYFSAPRHGVDLAQVPVSLDAMRIGLQRKCEQCEEEDTASLRREPMETEEKDEEEVQAQLTVGAPGDKFEEEADRVADQVMTMADPAPVQRAEVQEEEEEQVQTAPAGGSAPRVTADAAARIHTMRGGGHPLPTAERGFFEPRFGVDFGQVRVHHDAHAGETARMVSAKAFTLGSDIVFGASQYAPGTSQGRRLLAHELTHVMQQGHGVQRKKR